MSIALPSITLLILLLPGIIYRRFYFTEEFSKQYFKSTFGDLLISTLLPAIIIHIAALITFVYTWTSVDFEVLGTFLSGNTESEKLDYAFKSLSDNKLTVSLYFIVVSLVGMIAGGASKYFIRKNKYDRKYKLFRYQNEWHYLFSGEILDFPRIDGRYDDVDFRYIDALVDTSEGLIIYQGVLEDYVLSKQGGIDRIYLSDVKRRKFSDDLKSNEDENKYYEMPGEFFVIPYNQVVNIHIIYYKVELDESVKSSDIVV